MWRAIFRFWYNSHGWKCDLFIIHVCCACLPPIYHFSFFSPWIVATTFLECRLVRNSKYQIPCHVPVANFPSVIGIVTLAPISALLMWACSRISVVFSWTEDRIQEKKDTVERGTEVNGKWGLTGISSFPSAECLYSSPRLLLSSGARRSSASLTVF